MSSEIDFQTSEAAPQPVAYQVSVLLFTHFCDVQMILIG